jgi:hypothetical protein
MGLMRGGRSWERAPALSVRRVAGAVNGHLPCAEFSIPLEGLKGDIEHGCNIGIVFGH